MKTQSLAWAMALSACRASPDRAEVVAPELDSVVVSDSAAADTSGPDTATVLDTADTAPPPMDADADGFTVDSDCDDGDAAVYPGAPEDCSAVDHDCDGEAGCDADDAWATVTYRYVPPYRTGPAGDFNGDGRDELWIAVGYPTWYESYHYVLDTSSIMAGPQTIEVVAGVFTGTGHGLDSVPLGDVDGDGLADFSLVDYYAEGMDNVWEDNWGVWYSDAHLDGRELSRSDAGVDVPGNVGLPRGLWGGDLDGDGVGEVLVVASGGTINYHDAPASFVSPANLLDGTWTWQDVPGFDDSDVLNRVVVLGDLDGDGLDDVGVAHRVAGDFATVLHASDLLAGRVGSEDILSRSIAACPSGYNGILSAAGDADGDGFGDVVSQCAGDGASVVSGPALAPGIDPLGGFVSFPLPEGYVAIGDAAAVADVDGDSHPELALAYQVDLHGSGFTAVYNGLLDGGTKEPTDAAWLATGREDYEDIADGGTHLFIDDISGDGLPEYVGFPTNGFERMSVFSIDLRSL